MNSYFPHIITNLKCKNKMQVRLESMISWSFLSFRQGFEWSDLKVTVLLGVHISFLKSNRNKILQAYPKYFNYCIFYHKISMGQIDYRNDNFNSIFIEFQRSKGRDSFWADHNRFVGIMNFVCVTFLSMIYFFCSSFKTEVRSLQLK